jgi:hypothetical protein
MLAFVDQLIEFRQCGPPSRGVANRTVAVSRQKTWAKGPVSICAEEPMTEASAFPMSPLNTSTRHSRNANAVATMGN